LIPPAEDGWFEHPANALEYGVVAFTPPNPEAVAGLVRNTADERKARQLLRVTGREHGERGRQTLQSQIMQVRIQREQERAENPVLRFAQRDDGETFG
jgi:hypothetical protein